MLLIYCSLLLIAGTLGTVNVKVKKMNKIIKLIVSVPNFSHFGLAAKFQEGGSTIIPACQGEGAKE